MCSSDLTISTARDPRYTVIWKSTKLVNFSFLAVFVVYSTRFFAPGTISTARDTRYTVIWKSIKLMSFVISGRFHRLWHTVFGSGDDLYGP